MGNPARVVDRWQQAWPPSAFLVAVVKKFGDDAAGSQAALVAYYGFVALFPLLLVFVTILGRLDSHGSFGHSLTSSALAQFPLTGPQLGANIHALRATSVVGIVVGLLFSLYGALGVSQAGQRAMAEVWNIPGIVRPGYFPRLLRSVGFFGVLILDVFATTGLASLSTFGLHLAISRNIGFQFGVELLVLLVNVAVYWLAFRILTPASVATRDLLPGAGLGGLGWTVLQGVGVYLVGHNLRYASQVYGTFGIVLGLVAWLYLAAEVSLYAAEFNVVLKEKLWPRGIVQPPLTRADRRVLDRIAKEGRRRPEQRLESSFEPARDNEGSVEGATVGSLESSTFAELPQALVQARQHADISPADLGKLVGLDGNQIRDYEATGYAAASTACIRSVIKVLETH